MYNYAASMPAWRHPAGCPKARVPNAAAIPLRVRLTEHWGNAYVQVKVTCSCLTRHPIEQLLPSDHLRIKKLKHEGS